MPAPSLPPISPLRGLLEVTSLVRAEGDLPELLGAIARTISESLGYRTVVVNLYRPAWDDFCVTTVHGNEGARAVLLGQVRSVGEWTPLLAPGFARRGAFVVPAGQYDWDEALGGRSYVPDGEPAGEADSWHPEDALFLPLRHTAGHLLALEHLLGVSSRLTAEPASDEIMRVVCSAVRDALGFQNVLAALCDLDT